MEPKEINNFWFSPRIEKQWFASTPELDDEIRQKYEAVWTLASTGELDSWGEQPDGCLALVIILDQLPLNMYRNQPKSFSTEHKAVQIAGHAIDSGFDQRMAKQRRAFLYMPFMHCENLAQQDQSVQLYRDNKLDGNIRFAEHHREIIRTFGRFPHRNAILKRVSTEEELAYLASKSAFKG